MLDLLVCAETSVNQCLNKIPLKNKYGVGPPLSGPGRALLDFRGGLQGSRINQVKPLPANTLSAESTWSIASRGVQHALP